MSHCASDCFAKDATRFEVSRYSEIAVEPEFGGVKTKMVSNLTRLSDLLGQSSPGLCGTGRRRISKPIEPSPNSIRFLISFFLSVNDSDVWWSGYCAHQSYQAVTEVSKKSSCLPLVEIEGSLDLESRRSVRLPTGNSREITFFNSISAERTFA